MTPTPTHEAGRERPEAIRKMRAVEAHLQARKGLLPAILRWWCGTAARLMEGKPTHPGDETHA